MRRTQARYHLPWDCRPLDHNEFRLRLVATNACNCNCSFCHHEGYDGPIELLRPEDLVGFLRVVHNLRLRVRCCITGGEPLLHPEIFTLLSLLRRDRAISRLWLATNGVILSQYIEQVIDSAVDELHVSIHYADEKQLREVLNNTYISLPVILDAVDKVATSGIKVIVNAVLFDETCVKTQIFELLELTRMHDAQLHLITPLGSTPEKSRALAQKVNAACRSRGLECDGPDGRVTTYLDNDTRVVFISPCSPEELPLADRHNGAIFLTPDGRLKRMLSSQTFSVSELPSLLK